MEIIVKRYEHFNRALGKYIRNKSQYDYEMKSRGFVTQEEGDRLASSKEKEKVWKPSKQLVGMLREIKNHKDENGNFKPSQRMQEGMRKLGMKTELPDWCPKHYKEGGYAEST